MKKKIILISIIIILFLGGLIGYYKFKNYSKEPIKKEFSYSPLTFEICDDNSCIYLLGSIHLGDEKITKFNEKYLDYYNKSKYLAVEIDTKNISFNLKDFILTPPTTLDDLLNEELKKELSDFLSKKSLFSYDMLKGFKLGYVYNYISLLASIELNFSESGVDEYFINLAHNQDKEVIELETTEEQLSLLLDYSDEFYIKQIKNVIDTYEEEKDSLKLVYEKYLESDKKELEKLISLEETPESEEEQRYINNMLYERNKKMSIKVEEFLSEDKEVFMIVGLGHVIGEDGIIDLLKEKNYEINIVK